MFARDSKSISSRDLSKLFDMNFSSPSGYDRLRQKLDARPASPASPARSAYDTLSLFRRIVLLISGLILLALPSIFTAVAVVGPIATYFETGFWEPVGCEITTSKVAEDSQGNFKAEVHYTYTFQGKTFTATAIKSKKYSTNNLPWAEAKTIVERYPQGNKLTCNVNPEAPEEAYLERVFPVEALLGMAVISPFFLLPVIFFLYAFGISLRKEKEVLAPAVADKPSPAPPRTESLASKRAEIVWTINEFLVNRRLRAQSGESVASPPKPVHVTSSPAKHSALSEKRVSGFSEKKISIIIGSIFLGVGVAIVLFLYVVPFLQKQRSINWVETPCLVLKSEVRPHKYKDGSTEANPTFSIYIRYEYEWAGNKNISEKYDFSAGRDNIDVEGKYEAVRQHPPGRKTVCFVNPDNPREAVLKRKMGVTMWFAPAIGGIFALAGLLAVLFGFFWERREHREQEKRWGL
ncbi:MAG: DUF3592 domain-containing protein [Puniceicoccales bacterium]|jgi:hypothetical protein|nr:DUF3592 domain-containing protein [Puniceicoccales bacterium]